MHSIVITAVWIAYVSYDFAGTLRIRRSTVIHHAANGYLIEAAEHLPARAARRAVNLKIGI